MTHFIRLIRSSVFPRPTTASFSLQMAGWGAPSSGGDVRAVLNCARVIARVLPIVWEDESDWTRWLWEEGQEEDADTSDANDGVEPQFVIEDDGDEAPDVEPKAVSKKRTPSLMAQFLAALVDSLFHAGFTLPGDAAEDTTKTSYLIW